MKLAIEIIPLLGLFSFIDVWNQKLSSNENGQEVILGDISLRLQRFEVEYHIIYFESVKL